MAQEHVESPALLIIGKVAGMYRPDAKRLKASLLQSGQHEHIPCTNDFSEGVNSLS